MKLQLQSDIARGRGRGSVERFDAQRYVPPTLEFKVAFIESRWAKSEALRLRSRVHVFAPLFCFIIVAILLDLLLVPSFYPWVGRSRVLIYAGLGVWLTFCLLLLLATCSAVF